MANKTLSQQNTTKTVLKINLLIFEALSFTGFPICLIMAEAEDKADGLYFPL